jgi:periplasmic protein TonB
MVDQAVLPLSGWTANERLKVRAGSYFWGSLAVAAALHYFVLAYAPTLTAADVSIESEPLEQVELPPQVEIPPPPEQIVRPAIPLMSTSVDVDADVTIAPNDFDMPPTELPPPPVGAVDISATPTFTPYEVRPTLRNPEEYGRALLRDYPSMLRDAGIGGTVVLWVFIDEEGVVQTTRVTESSGYEPLDRVAESLMRDVARYTPAMNRDQRVPVWIQQPVTFEAEDR